MLMNQKLSRKKSSVRLPAPNEKVLITAIATAFLFLHILAALILLRTATDAPVTPREQAGPSLHD
jgi:hypothetical protein